MRKAGLYQLAVPYANLRILKKMAEEKGVKIVRKKNLHKHPGQYAVSLKDILEGKEIWKNE